MTQQNMFHKWRANQKIRLATFPHPLPSMENRSHIIMSESPEGLHGHDLSGMRSNPGYISWSVNPFFHMLDDDQAVTPDTVNNMTNMPHCHLEIRENPELQDKTSGLFKNLFEGHTGIIPHPKDIQQSLYTTSMGSEKHPVSWRYRATDNPENSPISPIIEGYSGTTPIKDEESLKHVAKNMFSFLFNSGLRNKYSRKTGTEVPPYVLKDMLEDNGITISPEELSKLKHIPKYAEKVPYWQRERRIKDEHPISPEEKHAIDLLTHHHSKLLEEYMDYFLNAEDREQTQSFPEFIHTRHPDPELAKHLHNILLGIG